MRCPGLLVIVSVGLVVHPCQAGTRDAIGFTRLAAELGPDLPTGAGVHAGLVEANVSPRGISYVPNPTHPQFLSPNKRLHFESTLADISAHATIVGSLFFGNTSSIAPGIMDVDIYFAETWKTEDYLQTGTSLPPAWSAARVFNHSWVDDRVNSELLARLDYTVSEHGVIHVVGVNNAGNVGSVAGLASAYNVISVGRTDGRHESGSVPVNGPASLDAYYGSGLRTKPDLVVPEPFTSYATPYVSASAALLVEAARNHPQWSHGIAAGTAAVSPTGFTSAERPETIKAVLMAGAQRLVFSDYAQGEFASDNGLDARYGAGQLDVYQSYHILSHGEQDSVQAGGPATIGYRGFDFIDAFAPADVNSYRFATGLLEESLAVSVAWNLDVTIDGRQIRAAMPSFDVVLTKFSSDNQAEVVWQSNRARDNSQHIWLPGLEPLAQYELTIFRSVGVAAAPPVPWHVAVAWNRQPVELLPGDVNGDFVVNLLDFNIVKSNFGLAGGRPQGDLTGDGIVGLDDFTLMKSHFGTSYPSVSSKSAGASLIPEPSSWLLLAIGLVLVRTPRVLRPMRRSN